MAKDNRGPPSLAEYADQEAVARYEENQEIARELRAVRMSARESTSELDELRQRLSLFERLDKSRLAPPKWLAPKARKGKAHLAIPSMLLTDAHWGEKVSLEQVGGVNKYDVDIAKMRMRRAFDRAVYVSKHMWSGIEYEGFNLLLGGDMLSGLIHEELRETNEESVFESILGVVECLTAGTKMLASEFPKVHVACVVGNHGRLTRKPRAKNKVKENFDWMVYQMLARELDQDPKVAVQIAESSDCKFAVYETVYCLTHGDQFRGGSGISAALSPLLLGVHRKLKRAASAGDPFDVLVMGHWHTSYWLQNVIVGGAVKGYDEFAFDKNFDFQEPRAELWLNTPERGITTHSPLFVQNRTKEGW